MCVWIQQHKKLIRLPYDSRIKSTFISPGIMAVYGSTKMPSFGPVTRYPLSSNDPAHQFDVHNPATGDVITTVQGAGVPEVERAIATAQKAYEEWRWVSPSQRAMYLNNAADHLAAHFDELAHLLSAENGKPVAQARDYDINFLVLVFRYFGSLIDKLPGEMYDKGGIYTSVLRE